MDLRNQPNKELQSQSPPNKAAKQKQKEGGRGEGHHHSS
jgi:hypothetical protein